MFELASGAVRTVKFFMEALAELSLVVLGDILLRVQFLCTMSEGTGFFEGTVTSEFPILAQLCLVFSSEIFRDRAGSCLVILIGIEEAVIFFTLKRFERLSLRDEVNVLLSWNHWSSYHYLNLRRCFLSIFFH